VELVRGRGLHYGAADLAVDRDGEYVFFEVNPAGEWLWLEQLLAIGIPDAIADLLLGRADD
jgi:D-alanine-D-alanine ligase-like ATP-grasp enzyme